MSQLFHTSLRYASHMELFDPYITSGPTVTLPASFFVSLAHPLLPRVVIALYSFIIIFLVLRYLLLTFKEKITYLVLLFFIPLYFFFSAHVLGEIPAFAFFLAALMLFYKKNYFFSGVCLLLSIFTKNVYIFGFSSLIYLFIIQQRITLRACFFFFLGMVLPLFLWEFYHFASFGYNLSGYITSLVSFRQVAESVTTPAFLSIGNRLAMLEYVTTVNGYLVMFFVFFICCFTLLYLSKKKPVIASLAFFTLIYFLFFMFADYTTIYRHLMPTVLSLSVVIPVFLMHIVKKWNKHYLLFFSLIGFVLGVNIYINVITGNTNQFAILRLTQQGMVFYNESIFPPITPDPMLIAQENLAQYIRNNNIVQLTGNAWWNAPEIAYLADRKIERNPYKHKQVYFVTDAYGLIFGAIQTKKMLALPNKKVFDATLGYALYKKL